MSEQVASFQMREHALSTFVVNPLVPIYENGKIALEIVPKIASVHRLLVLSHLVSALHLPMSNSGLHKIFNFLGPQCLSKYFLQVMRFLAKVTFLSIISDFLDRLFSSASSFYKVYLMIGDMLDY